MKFFKSLCSSLIILSSTSICAADISGKWRSIDDKTGFSKAIIEIKKDSDGSYSGKIIEILARPGYTPKYTCDKCKGQLKDQPILGLQILNNMKPSHQNPLEYMGGTVLDPLTGGTYKGTLKLNISSTRLLLRGTLGIDLLGRSQTWIRQK